MRSKGAAENHEAVVVALADAANRRAKGLVASAYRAGRLALGSDAAEAEFASGKARLVVLATDARAAARKQWLEDAVSAGLAWGWSRKAELGALVGRDEMAVFVITGEGLARSLKQVLALTTPATSRLAEASLAELRSTVATTAAGSHGLEDSEDG
jgi:ribosomal protein L7Ae-like RNA K-turn-binding protein